MLRMVSKMLIDATESERRSFELRESGIVYATFPAEEQKNEKVLKGTWRGRPGKTQQDKMKVVADRPRVKAWHSRKMQK